LRPEFRGTKFEVSSIQNIHQFFNLHVLFNMKQKWTI